MKIKEFPENLISALEIRDKPRENQGKFGTVSRVLKKSGNCVVCTSPFCCIGLSTEILNRSQNVREFCECTQEDE